MTKEFNLSEKIEVNVQSGNFICSMIHVQNIKEFIKRRNALDNELWIGVMGEIDINTKLKLICLFENHKSEKNKLAGDKLC